MPTKTKSQSKSSRTAPAPPPRDRYAFLHYFGVREVGILWLATGEAILIYLFVPLSFVYRLGIPIIIITLGALFAFVRIRGTNNTLEKVILSMLFHRE